MYDTLLLCIVLLFVKKIYIRYGKKHCPLLTEVLVPLKYVSPVFYQQFLEILVFIGILIISYLETTTLKLDIHKIDVRNCI